MIYKLFAVSNDGTEDELIEIALQNVTIDDNKLTINLNKGVVITGATVTQVGLHVENAEPLGYALTTGYGLVKLGVLQGSNAGRVFASPDGLLYRDNIDVLKVRTNDFSVSTAGWQQDGALQFSVGTAQTWLINAFLMVKNLDNVSQYGLFRFSAPAGTTIEGSLAYWGYGSYAEAFNDSPNNHPSLLEEREVLLDNSIVSKDITMVRITAIAKTTTNSGTIALQYQYAGISGFNVLTNSNLKAEKLI